MKSNGNSTVTLPVFLILFLAACRSQQVEVPKATRPFQLSDSRPDYIKGVFDDGNVRVQFESFATETSKGLLVSSANGDELVRVDYQPATTTTSVLQGRATEIIDLAILEEVRRQALLPEDQRISVPASRVVVQMGDPFAFKIFAAMPEAGVLPWLSRELGVMGITGRSHPGALPLHLFAQRVGAENNTVVPPLTIDEEEAAGLMINYCEDLRPDPHHDNAFGMCGPGTTCWEWVCGDCCCHDGCKSHDWTCRNCHIYTPLNCVLCATFASFAWGACGTNCQETTISEPPCVPTYGICDGTTKCCGEYDGSTEAGAAPHALDCVAAETDCCSLDDGCLRQCQRYRCQPVGY